MKLNSHIISHPQGSEAWAQHRAASLNASDLAAAMGLSKYQTRSELIERLATGITPEVDAMTQARFDKGHANEAAAEPKAAEVIGEELYPMVLAAEVPGLKRKMSGSFDGLTLMQDMSWENKSPNAALVQSVQAGVIPPEYRPQMEQGLMLSGAGKCLFTVSDGEVFVSAWYESDPDLRAKIIPTWQQIEADVAAYVPPSPSAVEKIVAEPVEALPAVFVQVTGSLALTDNFKVFEDRMRDFLANRLIREPKTDQDFADLDVQIKSMKAAEAALDAAEGQMLAQITAVDQAKKTKDMLFKLVRENRLMAEKLLASEKERRKGEIVAGGVSALKDHISALIAQIGKPYLPAIPADFGGALKGLRSLASMEDAVSTELARAKIVATETANRVIVNLAHLQAEADGLQYLFADAAHVVLKDTDDFKTLVALRVSQHKAAEAAKEAAARERIRAEEQAKAEKAAREKLAAELAEASAKAELEARLATAQQREDERQAELAGAVLRLRQNPSVDAHHQAMREAVSIGMGIVETTMQADGGLTAKHIPVANVVPLARPAAPADTGARVKLGDIAASIAPLSITADGLAQLGFAHVATQGAAKLYRTAEYTRMVDAMVASLLAAKENFTRADHTSSLWTGAGRSVCNQS